MKVHKTIITRWGIIKQGKANKQEANTYPVWGTSPHKKAQLESKTLGYF